MTLAEHLSGPSKPPPPFRQRPELLLQPQIPMPMSGVAPRVVLGEAWWDKVRHAAYASTGYRCAACGSSRGSDPDHPFLEAHEVYEIDYLLGRMVYVETVPLCYACHAFIHCGRLVARVNAGEVTEMEARAVLRHGNHVLREAGLKKPIPYAGPCAAWGDWRMVVDGKEYPPLYASRAAWDKEFGLR